MIGLDVGSTTAKIVKLREGKIDYFRITSSQKWKSLLEDFDKEKICSTGYFRHTVPHDFVITEISAAILGSQFFFKDLDVIVDIGGQDTKVIDVKRNNFKLNDKCSAGTGAFLEFIANYFDIEIKELEKLHFKGEKVVKINQTCGVFAISEMISALVEGNKIEDVIKGLHFAFAERIAGMIPDGEKIVLIGGTSKNKGIVSAISEILGKEVFVPKEPQIVNAVGAALFCERSSKISK